MLRRIIPALLCLLMLCAAPAITLVAPHAEAPIAANAPADAYSPRIYANFSLVRRITCGTPGTGNSGVGTGLVISDTTIMTADHVLVGTTCIDDASGMTITPFYRDYEHDVAFVKISGISFPNRFQLSCRGFTAGKVYSAIGYMYGDDLVMTNLKATFVYTSGNSKSGTGRESPWLRILKGDLFKGMSGGPIIDEDGVVIGINTATDHEGTAFSRELRDTILCDSKHKHD